MHYIDIHSHKKARKREGIIRIHNLFPENIPDIKTGLHYSVGLHPWYIRSAMPQDIESALKKPEVIAVGETGLDKTKPDFNLQIKHFKKQVKIAEKHRLPLIIHCVKAYQEVYGILEDAKFKQPVIFHWFSGSLELAQQLTKQSYYLSFGQSLFQKKSKTLDAFRLTSAEFIFLETDASDFSIKEIYKQAAKIKGLSEKELFKIICDNYTRVFGKAKA